MRNRDVRAVEYRRLATAAQALADASPLDHVREKHERAASTWAALAELDERPSNLDAGRVDTIGSAPAAAIYLTAAELSADLASAE